MTVSTSITVIFNFRQNKNDVGSSSTFIEMITIDILLI